MSKKNILIIIGIIILLVIGYMFTQKDPSVSEQLTDIETELAVCQERLANWQTDYGSEEPRSEEGEAELNAILDDCQEVIDAAENQI